MEVTPVFEVFWRYAAERQNIFFKRMRGEPGPWTSNPIFQAFRITNVYRVSDRASQYLIRSVIYDGKESTRSVEDTFFRILLFKLFNLPATWERYAGLGEISYRPGILEDIDTNLTNCVNNGIRTCSPAYMMTGSGSKGQPRHRMYLRLLDQWMADGVPRKMANAKSMEEGFKILRPYRLMGDFLAMQYTLDWNYSPVVDWSESEFIAAGPGTLRGIQKCFKDVDLKSNPPIEIISYMAEHQDYGFRKFGLVFQRLGDRPLQMCDISNWFCETDKISRVLMPELDVKPRRIKNTFEANPKPIEYFYPPKWKIDRWGFKTE